MSPKQDEIIESLQDNVGAILDQVQLSAANHRKNCVALYKIQKQASGIIKHSKKKQDVLVGEDAFGDAFIELVSRVLTVKRGAGADRVVKFIGTYVKFVKEKVSDQAAKRAPPESSSAQSKSADEEEDTFASRFESRLLGWFLNGFEAKNKTVRFRCTQIIAELVAHLGEIDEDSYSALRRGLVGRVFDKEPSVRSHTIVALSKLVGSEDPSELEDGEQTILEVLLDVLQFDPSPEVRRATLINIPLGPASISTVLTRTRDVDTVTRRLLYASVLQSKIQHPRQLSIAQREQVVKDGLGDREPAVRLAASKLIGAWFNTVSSEAQADGDWGWVGDDGGIMRALASFLQIFDIVGSGEPVAVDALSSLFVTRNDILDVIVFEDDYWKALTPESALLARVFVDHCSSINNDARLEAAGLPVVTALAFYMQEAYNLVLTSLQDAEETRLLGMHDDETEGSEQREETLAKAQNILAQLLRIAAKLDYADEIGRRKVSAVIRDMLAQEHLSESLIEPCLDVLKEILPSERELIRVVVEIVLDLRDTEENQEMDENPDVTQTGDETQSEISHNPARRERSFQRAKERYQMTPEEQQQADFVDLRCLLLCIAMLERVNGSFEDNSTLEGVLSDLIIPAVKRKEPSLREKGLISLGLCCLIAKNMALNSFQLFLGQVQTAPDDLKLKVLQVIFDLLLIYDQEFFQRSQDIAERIIAFLLHTLENEESNIVQAMLCVGISKLLLSGHITDEKVLTSLLLAYVSPATADNPELRQCLSYFFPVYCYSSPTNQRRTQSVFIAVYDLVRQVREDLEEGEEMIQPYQFGLLLVDWTNPQKAAKLEHGPHLEDVHVDLAISLLGALYDSERNDADRKTLCQLLGHLYFPSEIEDRLLLKLNILLRHLPVQCPFENASTEKVMSRFASRFTKQYALNLKRLNPHTFLEEPEFQELYDFIGVQVPERAESPGDTRQDDQGASDRAGESSSEDDERASSPTPTRKARHENDSRSLPKANPKRVKTPPPADEDETGEEVEHSPTPLPSTPKKVQGVKRLLTTPGTATPARKKRSKRATSRQRTERPKKSVKALELVSSQKSSPRLKKGTTNVRHKSTVVQPRVHSSEGESDSEEVEPAQVSRKSRQSVDDVSEDQSD